eukprot:TRINITY_DN658_c0_g2_i1.p1 TRINITY_DN658_c0_g2~~TRINITY_DN658_c0_g2_i1.p1  ORF type:complete len:498 (-),score=99.36 TRINITY_DN658_c0_g2_i1:308-1801(-)
MAGTIPYIGSKISLITTSDIRYEGILYTLNREESTIAVQNVRSFGTEGRRVPEVTMSNEIYDFIIFRGKDLKDLTVLQGAPERASTGPGAFGSPDYPDQGLGASAYGAHSAAPAAQAHQRPAAAPAAAPGGPSSAAPGSGYSRHGAHGLASDATEASRHNGYPATSAVAGNLAPMSAGGLANSYVGGGGYSSTPLGSAGAAQASLAHGGRSFGSTAEPPAPLDYQAGRLPSHFDEGNGMPGSRADLSSEGKGAVPRGPHESDLMAPEGKDLKADSRPRADEARGRGGKGGAQKKSLAEVLRFHKRAEEAILKLMRSHNSANIGPSDLRSASESNQTVYHFYIDFVNYCLPTPVVQTDEQQWEMLCKALKKHFEKEFPNQNQKVAQVQRPNNTLGDYIPLQADLKAGKKQAKAKGATGGGGGGGGGRGGRGPGRGDKKDGPGDGADAGAGGSDDGPSASTHWTCPRCTLRNENFLTECAACGTSKRQAALWAEFPPLG